MRNTSWSGNRTGFSTAIRRRILNRDHHQCTTCGAPATTADHVLPVAEGGTHDEDNGQALCDPCHDAKTRAEQARGRARRTQQLDGRLTRPAGKHPGEL